MINIKNRTDLQRLRRHMLQSQGLQQSQAFGRGKKGTLAALKHLGYVQIDSISVVERAHHHTLYSRVPDYQPDMLNGLLATQDAFEYWSHAAAFLPIEDYRFSLPYKLSIKNGQVHWYKNPDKKMMKQLLERICAEGPIRSRELEQKASSSSGWWDWKPAKKALEQLYMEGDIMVSDRNGFQKTYDLTERVLPESVDTRIPDIDEQAEYLLNQQLRCNGLVATKGIAYLRKGKELKQAVKALVNEKVSSGALQQFSIHSMGEFVMPSGLLDQPLPRRQKKVWILSPFDNLTIQRERLKAVFNFDYQLECYVPANKRLFGYFSLPLLYSDEFIGRMDCKVHRKDRHLEVKSLYLEPADFGKTSIVQQGFLPAFQKAISRFMQFQQCERVSFTAIYPQSLTKVINDLTF